MEWTDVLRAAGIATSVAGSLLIWALRRLRALSWETVWLPAGMMLAGTVFDLWPSLSWKVAAMVLSVGGLGLLCELPGAIYEQTLDLNRLLRRSKTPRP